MKRLFWLAAGVTIGVLIVRKLSRAAESMTPAGLASSMRGAAGSLAQAVRDFTGDVRDGMSERERELSEGVGLDGTLGAKSEDFGR